MKASWFVLAGLASMAVACSSNDTTTGGAGGDATTVTTGTPTVSSTNTTVSTTTTTTSVTSSTTDASSTVASSGTSMGGAGGAGVTVSTASTGGMSTVSSTATGNPVTTVTSTGSNTTTVATTSTGSLTVTATSTTSTGSGTPTCEQLTNTCSGDGTDPASGCVECAVLGDSSIATDGGSCVNAYIGCFGTDASCTGGQAGCCALVDCQSGCDTNGNGVIDNSELACFCTVDPNDPTQCSATQTNVNTCAGALEANTAAFNAYSNYELCLEDSSTGVCKDLCGAIGTQPTCEQLTGTCSGDGSTPSSGCLECTILGDSTTASDGGICLSAYEECFGTAGDCSDGAPGCCTYFDCINACDANGNGAIDQNELACVCTPDPNDPTSCNATQTNTANCQGALLADATATQAVIDYQTCEFDATSGACTTVCQ